MRIELTEQQRQALQEQGAEPTEVLDPVTARVYVLVPREQYERWRALSGGGPPAKVTPAAPPSEEVGPLRQRLADLPTPPEVAARVQSSCKRLGLWRTKYVQEVENQLKLQYYYGGQWVAYLSTEEGIVIVAAGRPDSDAFERQLSLLSTEERYSAVRTLPSLWNDPDSQI
jgi:hypothetical protein